MKGYVINIEKEAEDNNNFRRVLYTASNSQLVVMSLNSKEDIGEEAHSNLDQFIRIEKGVGKAILNGAEHLIGDGSVVVVPAGTRHNIINTSEDSKMKLYTLYSPPNHRFDVVHATKEEAMKDDEHFDGKLSE